MPQVFADGARVELDTSISAEDVSLNVIQGGELFPVADYVGVGILPQISPENWFKLVIQDDDGFEVVYCYSHSVGSNTFNNLRRGMDGTTARAFSTGAVVGLRPLAKDMGDLVSRAKTSSELLETKADKTGNIEGNAATATKLESARALSISGGVTAAAKYFDGSLPVDLEVTAIDVSKANAGTLPVARGGTGSTTATGTGKLVLDNSPAFTGTPTAPTAAVGTNNTQVATTGFVATGLSGKSDTNHTHSNATTSSSGFMSSTDKTKLDDIELRVNKSVLSYPDYAAASAAAATLPDGQVVDVAETNTRYDVSAGVLVNQRPITPFSVEAGVVRSVQDKLATDLVSVKDFGAIGDGVVDDTDAFVSAQSAFTVVTVPDGIYNADTTQFDVSRLRGSGLIRSHGNLLSLESPLVSGNVVQKKLAQPFYGFNNGTIDTQIYPNAQFAPQGVAYLNEDGVESIFVVQRDTSKGAAWASDEEIIICKFPLADDGSVVGHVEKSPNLVNSHAHLSTWKDDDGVLWLYTSAATEVGQVQSNGGSGKGFAKIRWRGAGTLQAEIETFRVFGNPGSGHIYQHYGNGRTCVSTDGKYIIILAVNYAGGAGGFTLFVYDRAQVEALANPLDARPVYPPVLLAGPGVPGSTGQQGEACDGKHIYVQWGSPAALGRRAVTVHEMDGTHVRTLFLDGPRGQYTNEELLNHPTLGVAASFEPEGLTLRGNDLLGIYVDFFCNSSDVVTWEGSNFAALGTSLTGVMPSDDSQWTRTTRPATRGEWSATETYSRGNVTKRGKVVYAFRAPTGAAGEEDIGGSLQADPAVGTSIGDRTNQANILFERSQPLRIKALEPVTGKYYDAIRYQLDFGMTLYDISYGSDNTQSAGIKKLSTPSESSLTITSVANLPGSGAWLRAYSGSSSTSPGELRLSSSGSGTVRLMQAGTTKLTVTSDANIFYQIIRPVADNNISLCSPTYRASVVYAGTGAINTSDGREKTPPLAINDAVLDAWGDVQLICFQWLDSVARKGELARWHFGVIAQQVRDAFLARGLDGTHYGMLCYDEWEAKPEVMDAVGNVVEPAQEAGNRWGIRADQCLFLEAAYQRRRADRIESRLAALEAKL